MAWPCPKPKSRFNQATNRTGFYTRLQQALFFGELLELFRCLACLRFDVVYVSLE
jgi:hypothetical protein